MHRQQQTGVFVVGYLLAWGGWTLATPAGT